MEERGGTGNKMVWDLLVVVGVLLVGAAVGFWFSARTLGRRRLAHSNVA